MTHTTRLEPVPEDWERALAIVAHPDDLEYGAAAAVARWTDQGKQVVYLMVTRGEAGIDVMSPGEAGPIRAEEERRSAAVVGVGQVEFLDHRDGVIEYGLPLRRDLALAIRKHRPQVVVTLNHRLAWPGGGLNMADHRNVGLAVLDAVRDAGNRWVFTGEPGEGAEPCRALERSGLGPRLRVAGAHPRGGRDGLLRKGGCVSGGAQDVPGSPGQRRAYPGAPA